MPAPTTTDDYLELVRKSNLVDAEKLEEYFQENPPASLPQQPTLCAGRLVRDGLLTNFQAKQLRLGKYRGFTIGKYKLLERLGAGGSGTVYLCEHLVMRRRVAIKVLPGIKAENSATLARFHREARAVAALDHPNIVHAYDIDHVKNVHFLVMEYVDGCSLQELIENRGPLDINRAAHYIQQAALGLQHLHESGLVHRDIKPGNLLLDRQGTVKILDLGLARFFHDEQDNLTKEHSQANILGTADYLSPEQAMNSHDVDIRTDIYSLGATLYFLLTGRRPFEGKDLPQKLLMRHMVDPPLIRAFRPAVPTELEAVAFKMMARDPVQRYPDPHAVVEALAPWTQTPVPPPTDEEMPRLCLAARSSASPSSSSSHPRAAPKPAAAAVTNASEAAANGSASASQPNADESLSDSNWPLVLETLENLPGEEEQASLQDVGGDTAKVISTTREIENRAAARSSPSGPDARFAPVHAVVKKYKWQLAVAAAAMLLALLGGIALQRWLSPADPSPGRDKTFAAAPEAPAVPEKQSGENTQKPTEKDRPPAEDKNKPAALPEPKEKTKPHLLAIDPPRQPARLLVTDTGKLNTYRTVREALRHAKSGDLIVVQKDSHEEHLTLDETTPQNITIEGRSPSGKPVQWLPVPKTGPAIPLMKVSNGAGICLRRFVLDGQKQVRNLVVLTGNCPGVTVEEIEFQNFLFSAIRFIDCVGTEKQPVTLTRLRAVGGEKCDVALHFETRGGGGSEYCQVRDCRFEGPYKAMVRLVSPLKETQFERNRFFQADSGVWYRRTMSPHPVRLSLVSNTFSDLKQGLRFETVPPLPESSLVVNNNLFANTSRLCTIDGFKHRPDKLTANWIWFDQENPVKSTAAINCGFRRTFEVPQGTLASGMLNIVCDHQFQVWLNGALVGEGEFTLLTRRVYAFPLGQHVRPGKNVLAVHGKNRLRANGRFGAAGLLVQLVYQVEGGAPVLIESDSRWKSSKEPPAGWQQPAFDDSAWPAARVLEVTREQGPGAWKNLVWDSLVQERLGERMPPLIPAPKGNIRGRGCIENYPLLEARTKEFTLPNDPTSDDAKFLRYPKASELFKSGSNGSPVGVPPLN